MLQITSSLHLEPSQNSHQENTGDFRSVIHKNKSSVNLSLHKPQSSINVEFNLLDKTLVLLANVESKYSRLTPDFFRLILSALTLSQAISSL